MVESWKKKAALQPFIGGAPHFTRRDIWIILLLAVISIGAILGLIAFAASAPHSDPC